MVNTAEYIARPRPVIQTRIGEVDINIDYLDFFDSQLHPYGHEPRSKQVAEAQISRLTHGQTLTAEYSNPVGIKAERDPQLLVTYAIAQALEQLEGNMNILGETVNQSRPSGKEGKGKPKIERSSFRNITPISKDGKRLVTEKEFDGNTHRLFIHWVPEELAQNWIEEERQKIRANSG